MFLCDPNTHPTSHVSLTWAPCAPNMLMHAFSLALHLSLVELAGRKRVLGHLLKLANKAYVTKHRQQRSLKCGSGPSEMGKRDSAGWEPNRNAGGDGSKQENGLETQKTIRRYCEPIGSGYFST